MGWKPATAGSGRWDVVCGCWMRLYRYGIVFPPVRCLDLIIRSAWGINARNVLWAGVHRGLGLVGTARTPVSKMRGKSLNRNWGGLMISIVIQRI